MTKQIQECVSLHYEQWRIFQLLKENFDLLIQLTSGIKVKRQHMMGSTYFSEWQINAKRKHIASWKQEEHFENSNLSIQFKGLEGDLKRLQGEIGINGSGSETQLRIAAAILPASNTETDQPKNNLEKQSRAVIRRLLRAIKRSETSPKIRPLLNALGRKHVEDFLKTKMPNHLASSLEDMLILKELDQKQIMETIQFLPPFLKTHKQIIFAPSQKDLSHSTSISYGIVTQDDTRGHYNETIFLALCGWLMASSASIHLAVVFPNTAPQVIEANGVKPITLSSKGGKLWKPAVSGTPFYVQTQILKKKMQLVLTKTCISFGDVQFGVIDDLKLVLTPSASIFTATEIPPVV